MVGIDRSPQQVAAARSLGLAGVREGELLMVLESLESESQGLVIAFDVLEHFRKDEALRFMDQVNRVLAPGGKVIIHTPNGASPFSGRSSTGILPMRPSLPGIPWGNYWPPAAFSGSSATRINLWCMGWSAASVGCCGGCCGVS